MKGPGCKLCMKEGVQLSHTYTCSLKRRHRGRVSFLFSSAGKYFAFFFFCLFFLSGVWRTIRLHSTSDPDPCTLI